MAVVLSVPSQLYTPRTATFSPSFPAGASRIRVTLTGPISMWPPGLDYLDPDSGRVLANTVGRVKILRPNGEHGGAFVFPGGVSFTKSGSPSLVRDFEGALQASQQPLAASWGPYTVTAELLVPLTIAILVERF